MVAEFGNDNFRLLQEDYVMPSIAFDQLFGAMLLNFTAKKFQINELTLTLTVLEEP